MRKRIAMLGAAAAIGLSVLSFGPTTTQTAEAAPITCKGNQTVKKTGPGEFKCVTNNAQENPTGSGRTKNPTDKK